MDPSPMQPRKYSTKPNWLIRDNFTRSHVPDRQGPMGTCNHCGWMRSFHTKSLEDHLMLCSKFQGPTADTFRKEREEAMRNRASTDDTFRYDTESAPRKRGRKSYQETHREMDGAFGGEPPERETLMQTLRFKPFVPPQDDGDTPGNSAPAMDPRLEHCRAPRSQGQSGAMSESSLPVDPEYAMLESTLGMVWQALTRTGSVEARKHSPLWNLVAAHAPSVVEAPRRGGTGGGGEAGVYQLPGHLGGS